MRENTNELGRLRGQLVKIIADFDDTPSRQTGEDAVSVEAAVKHLKLAVGEIDIALTRYGNHF